MSHNLITEIKKMLTQSRMGTPMTFHRDESSMITNCAGSVLMTNELVQYVHLNPISVW